MIEKTRKQLKSQKEAYEQECCELYGEYCYPCKEPPATIASRPLKGQQKKLRQG